MDKNNETYLFQRENLVKVEASLCTGGNLKLNQKEQLVNRILLKYKHEELASGYASPSQFLPAQSFIDAKLKIEDSKVFKILKMLPKGTSLHTHFLAGVSADYIINNFTYRVKLYGKFVNEIFKLKFFETPDKGWVSLEEYRKQNSNFDHWLRSLITTGDKGSDITKIWQHFKCCFTTLYDLVAYRPVFEKFVYRFLEELYLDNVFYTEIRGTFMPLYEINGTQHSTEDFFKIFIAAVEKFRKDHPKFLGLKYIHSIYRGVEKDVLRDGLGELVKYKELFPEFIIGFDFVGFEEEGKLLVDFYDVLLEFKDKVKYFFHAGETLWHGHTDQNLLDAVLLNSSRIGHGFALSKHPALFNLALSKKIAIELCPISNQVLGLNQDPRNHPGVHLLAKSYPVVISNDDPSYWKATGLSYDWYVVFMAMTSRDSGVEALKKFAMNSIEFSEISDKENAMEMWENDWLKFIDGILESEERSFYGNEVEEL